jgi:hypothetical protein
VTDVDVEVPELTADRSVERWIPERALARRWSSSLKRLQELRAHPAGPQCRLQNDGVYYYDLDDVERIERERPLYRSGAR